MRQRSSDDVRRRVVLSDVASREFHPPGSNDGNIFDPLDYDSGNANCGRRDNAPRHQARVLIAGIQEPAYPPLISEGVLFCRIFLLSNYGKIRKLDFSKNNDCRFLVITY